MNDKKTEPTPAKPRGFPTKFNSELVAKFCELVGRGVPQNYAAALCDVSDQAILNWKRRYPDFEAAVRRALANGVDHRLKVIADAASTDWRAASWWLEHVMPDQFSKSRIEVSAVGQLDHAFVVPKETLDAIAEARAKLDRPNGGPPLLTARAAVEDGKEVVSEGAGSPAAE